MKKIKTLTLAIMAGTVATLSHATPEAVKSAELVFEVPEGILTSDTSPMDGWAMVYPKDDPEQYLLISNDGRYIITDTSQPIIDLEKRSSIQQQITEQKSEQLEPHRAEIFKALEPLVKTYSPVGEVKHRITVFSEPGCIFCRKMHAELQEYLDAGVEVNYALFVPEFSRNGVDLYIPYWVNKNDASIGDVVYGVQYDGQQHGLNDISHLEISDEDKNKAIQEISDIRYLAQQAGVRGTPFIIHESGKSISGYRPAESIIDMLNN